MINVDPKKVEMGLECCQYDSKSRCDGCPYEYWYGTHIEQCTSDLASDVLMLLNSMRRDCAKVEITVTENGEAE